MKYLLRKIFFLLLAAWAALTLNFFLPRLMPGDPASIMVAKYRGMLTPEAVDALKISFGIETDKHIVVQYVDYLVDIAKGDFGLSVVYFPQPVSRIMSKTIPWTVGLVGISTIIAFVSGIFIGIKTGWNRNAFLSDSIVPISLFLNAMPYFWFAMLILYLFSFVLGWFPLGGAYEPFGVKNSMEHYISILKHAFLPALTIIITSLGGWVLTMRNSMINVLAENYVLFAYARGLKDKKIKNTYVARNAILPSFTGFAMAMGFVIGGSIMTEIVFSYPGVGYTLYQAVIGLDYPLMQALFLFISIAVLIANFIADFFYLILDPRVRFNGE